MSDPIRLNPHEARALGVLIEKSLTTPDQYPLSLNAATAGCNQKNNRDPVVDYTEAEVQVAFTGLVMKGLAGKVVPSGSRVEKHRHNGREALALDDAGLAVLAELLMRGPQQPGELRGRAARMAPIPTLGALQEVLAQLLQRGFARRIEARPGERAERYVQLLCPDLHALDLPVQGAAGAAAPPSPRSAPGSALEARVAALEAQVAEIRSQLAQSV